MSFYLFISLFLFFIYI